MKTLADFKRDLEVGDSVLCIEIWEKRRDDKQLVCIDIPEKLKPMRLLTYKDTTGFYLKPLTDETIKKGSFCGYPKAKDLEYTDNTFRIIEREKDGEIWQTRLYQIFK